MTAPVDLVTQKLGNISLSSATSLPERGALWGRIVSHYQTSLEAILHHVPPNIPKELCSLIADYLKPRHPTELLVQATFADFMEPSAEEETRETARIWGRALPSMDYSRVFIVIDTGALPFAYFDNYDGKMYVDHNTKTSIPNERENPTRMWIPIDGKVFPTLASTAYTRYFPHITSLTNPHGVRVRKNGQEYYHLISSQAIRDRIDLGDEVVKADINNKVTVTDNSVTMALDFRKNSYWLDLTLQSHPPSESNPLFTVVLDMRPADQTERPSLRIERYTGAAEKAIIARNDNVVLPPEFAEKPVPEGVENSLERHIHIFW